MQLNIRHHEAVRSAMALIVVGISEDGYREILGLKIALRETAESWKELLEEPFGRGLRRVELATSDAHEGLESALRETFPGCIWQRCQAHFRRNVIDKTPSDYQGRMHQLLDQILEADSQQEASQRLEEVSSELEDEAEDALDVLEEGIFDATAVLTLPEKYRGRLRTTNMVERLIQEIRRREKVIRIFPNQASACASLGPCWPKNMKNGPPDGVTGRWTNSTSGGRSGPANTPKTCNRNHPIAPFNQPDRQCALHKKLDFVTHGSLLPLQSYAEPKPLLAFARYSLQESKPVLFGIRVRKAERGVVHL